MDSAQVYIARANCHRRSYVRSCGFGGLPRDAVDRGRECRVSSRVLD